MDIPQCGEKIVLLPRMPPLLVTLSWEISVRFGIKRSFGGDVHHIRIGDRVNIQDGAVIHATYKKAGTLIGNDVSIGHNAIVHGCTIHDNVLIGMGSIVMDNCIIHSNSIIAAGSVVTQGTQVEEELIYAGIPAKKIKDVDPSLQKDEIERIAQNYLMYSGWFKAGDTPLEKK